MPKPENKVLEKIIIDNREFKTAIGEAIGKNFINVAIVINQIIDYLESINEEKQVISVRHFDNPEKDYLINETPEPKLEGLTNGGEPHICGGIQVHNSPKGSVSLCPVCNLPVDSKAEDWREEFDRKWLMLCPLYELPVDQKLAFDQHDRKLKEIKEFISNLLSKTKEERGKVKRIIEILKIEAYGNGENIESYEKPLNDFLSALDK